MKLVLLPLIGVLSFFSFHYALIHNFPESQARKILYYYPNGFIFHTNSHNYHLLGYNIFEDQDLPSLNFEANVLEPTHQNLFSKILYDFLEYLVIAHLFVGFALWFFLRSGDNLFLFLFAFIGIFISSNFFVLVFNAYYFLFFFTLTFLMFILSHLVIRAKGLDVPTKWYIPEIAFSVLVGFLGRNSNENDILFIQLLRLLSIPLWMIGLSSIMVILYDAIKYKIIRSSSYNQESTNFYKKVVLGISICGLGIVPYLFLKFNLLKGTYSFTIFFCIFFLIFAFLFLYSSYGIAYLPQQLLFTSAISLFIQTSFYSLVYGMIYLFYKSLNIPEVTIHYINIFFLVMVVFLSTLIKNSLSDFIENLSLSKEKDLNKTLNEMIEIIQRPTSFRNSVKNLFNKASLALDVKKINLLVPAERFRNVSRLREFGLIEVPLKSPIWEYFSKEKDITITSYMSYGSGIREEVYRYLSAMQVQIAYPIFSYNSNGIPSSIFLVGEKNDKTNFSIAELKFIKECTRLGDLLMQNYYLIISDIEKKRMDKNLEFAQLQLTAKRTRLDIFNFDNLEVGYASFPAMGVSGDYLDFFTNSANQTISIFLGDVSGHGIGSGYMVSAVKGLVSELIQKNYTFEEIFKLVNEMLMTKFPGNLFMSLIGGIYNGRDSSFEFINAGHLHPLLIHRDKSLQYIQTPDRVLGIFPTSFKPEKIYLKTGDRLILFSDGVTETFNTQEEIFGIKRLENCILENFEKPTQELVNNIIHTLSEFRKGSDLSDDLTLICLTMLDEFKK